MGLLRCEKETVILLNDAEKTASISTSQDWMKRRIKKMAQKDPDNVKITREDAYTLFAEVPRKYVRISIPPRMSEEQRMLAAERLKKYRDSKMKNDKIEK